MSSTPEVVEANDGQNTFGIVKPEVRVEYRVFRAQPDGSLHWEEPRVVEGTEIDGVSLKKFVRSQIESLKARKQALKDVVGS